MIASFFAWTLGAVILGGIAFRNIISISGLNWNLHSFLTPDAITIILLTLAIGSAGFFVGRAFARRQFAIGLILMAPIHEANAERSRLEARVDDLMSRLSTAASPRLTAALAAQSKAVEIAATTSAERYCGRQCRRTLEAQTNAARAEVDTARAEVQSRLTPIALLSRVLRSRWRSSRRAGRAPTLRQWSPVGWAFIA